MTTSGLSISISSAVTAGLSQTSGIPLNSNHTQYYTTPYPKRLTYPPQRTQGSCRIHEYPGLSGRLRQRAPLDGVRLAPHRPRVPQTIPQLRFRRWPSAAIATRRDGGNDIRGHVARTLRFFRSSYAVSTEAVPRTSGARAKDMVSRGGLDATRM